MKGDKKMTFNANYAELLGRELQRNRMREAEKERLIRKASAWNPPLSRKLSLILSSRWQNYWSRKAKQKKFIPMHQVPKKSPSL